MAHKNLIGSRVYSWTVLKENGSDGRRRLWLCQCNCGKTENLTTKTLTSGTKKSCGCQLKKPRPHLVKDISDKQFTRLTVISYYGIQKKKNKSRAMWKCRCKCGNEIIAESNSLTSGNTQSCGCLKLEKTTTHGHAKNRKVSTTYSSWRNMIARCTQPSNPAHAYYKKRGITVCDRWKYFDSFLADMGKRPEGATLDRYPNNDGNYEPGNVRWSSKRDQANNRITNILFEWRGQKYTLADLARASGTSKETLRSRLCRSKLPWTVEGAISTPKLDKKRTREGFYC